MVVADPAKDNIEYFEYELQQWQKALPLDLQPQQLRLGSTLTDQGTDSTRRYLTALLIPKGKPAQAPDPATASVLCEFCYHTQGMRRPGRGGRQRYHISLDRFPVVQWYISLTSANPQRFLDFSPDGVVFGLWASNTKLNAARVC
jgi:hypothetical protein